MSASRYTRRLPQNLSADQYLLELTDHLSEILGTPPEKLPPLGMQIELDAALAFLLDQKENASSLTFNYESYTIELAPDSIRVIALPESVA